MTVKSLIEYLRQCNPEKTVVVETTYLEFSSIEKVVDEPPCPGEESYVLIFTKPTNITR